jgi:hypothetical protein
MSVNLNYKLCNNLILRFQYVKDLGVLLEYKLCFHHHIEYIFSQGLKMLRLICHITSSFPLLIVSVSYIGLQPLCGPNWNMYLLP